MSTSSLAPPVSVIDIDKLIPWHTHTSEAISNSSPRLDRLPVSVSEWSKTELKVLADFPSDT